MPELLDRLKTALANRYAIEHELGAGGMATVYLAADLRHHRKVAVKVLRPELAAILGAERFLKEIEVTANLQHPHILPLFDSGEADSFLYYVMPYVEGESLRDKLAREKQLGVDETIEIAKGVAAALDYAHRQGVIHRDIKPENILIHDGQPVVADFGIALAVTTAGGTRLTETGLSLGTPQYMSPEQATGEREVTARSDVYALGAVTYEMLVSDPPHTGQTVQAIIARVVSAEPQPISDVRRSVPGNVEAAVQKALAKVPADRFERATDFAEALTNPAFTLPTTAMATEQADTLWKRLSIALAALAAVTTVLLVESLQRPEPVKPTMRFSIRLPAGEGLRPPGEVGSRLAVSPDGSRLVYLGPGEEDGQLWLREAGQLHATPLPGTDRARGAFFFAPDGQEVAFFQRRSSLTSLLKVASLRGGPPRTLSDSGLQITAGDWHPDGYLYSGGFNGLRRILATGGVPQILTTTDSGQGEVGHDWPDALPNGRGVLFTIRRNDESDIAVLRFATGNVELLVPGTYARYAASGHLVFVTTDGTLLAAPFDQDKLELTGPAVALIEGVQLGPAGAASLALSETGTLVYETGAGTGTLVEPVWVARDGAASEIHPGWRIDGRNPSLALSPNGRQLAVGIPSSSLLAADRFRLGAGDPNVWIKQLDTGSLTPLTFEGGDRPAWTPDGRSVTFLSDRAGQFDLYVKPVDGGPAKLLWNDEELIREGFLSRDGAWIVYRIGRRFRFGDIYAIRPDVDSVGTALMGTEFAERAPALSPNGRWLAYESNESGREQVYVVSFPNVAEMKHQVSTAGGSVPVWARSGTELFYRNGANDLVAVDVMMQPTFSAGQQSVLFSMDELLGSPWHALYDVSPNDQRFVMFRPVRAEQGELIWVENFFEELKAKVAN